MPRVRFSVRLLMLAVLLVAIALGAFEVGRRYERAHTDWTLYIAPPPDPVEPPQP